MDTCEAEQILLAGGYVAREHNMAAHHLSRSEIDNFKTIVPNTFENPKKIKKIGFCLQFSELDTRREAGTTYYNSSTNVHRHLKFDRKLPDTQTQ